MGNRSITKLISLPSAYDIMLMYGIYSIVEICIHHKDAKRTVNLSVGATYVTRTHHICNGTNKQNEDLI